MNLSDGEERLLDFHPGIGGDSPTFNPPEQLIKPRPIDLFRHADAWFREHSGNSAEPDAAEPGGIEVNVVSPEKHDDVAPAQALRGIEPRRAGGCARDLAEGARVFRRSPRERPHAEGIGHLPCVMEDGRDDVVRFSHWFIEAVTDAPMLVARQN